MNLLRIAVGAVGVGLALTVTPSIAFADDGTTSVESSSTDVVPLAASSCPSNYFCIWSGANYAGTMAKYGVVNSYRDISLSNLGSYYNHRADRSWVFEFDDGSGRSICVGPGDRSGSVATWAHDAEAVYLSLIVNC